MSAPEQNAEGWWSRIRKEKRKKDKEKEKTKREGKTWEWMVKLSSQYVNKSSCVGLYCAHEKIWVIL